MKKVILILLTILTYSACAQAQIIETDSKMRTVIKEPEKPKSPRFTYYTAKIGGGAFNYDDRGQFSPCGNIELGVMRQLNDHGLYFGGEIGGILSTLYNGIKGDDETGFIFRIGPTLGLIKPVKENLEFDGHIGVKYAYYKSCPTSYCIAELGGGVWYKKYFAGVELQEYFSDNSNFGILLNFGIRF